jgi:hypothetical protein
MKRAKRYTQKKPWFKKPLWLVSCFGLVLVALVLVLELTNTITLFHSENTGLATQPTTTDRTAGPETKGEQPVPAESETKEEENANQAVNVTLKAPMGTFVSNHRPNLSGSPNPNEVQSICETTPGATCQIIFTKGSETKQLPVQKTDGEGAAYWTWKLQDIGLTSGTWKVQAKATLGSQTKTADDALDLEVNP